MKRYLVEFTLGMAGYVVLLVVSLRLLAHGVQDPGLRIAITLMPMLSTIFICRAVMRQLRRMDELQRKIQFDAFALAFIGTALLTFSYGFLENVGFPKLSMFFVWPILAALWVIGTAIGHLRYR